MTDEPQYRDTGDEIRVQRGTLKVPDWFNELQERVEEPEREHRHRLFRRHGDDS